MIQPNQVLPPATNGDIRLRCCRVSIRSFPKLEGRWGKGSGETYYLPCAPFLSSQWRSVSCRHHLASQLPFHCVSLPFFVLGSCSDYSILTKACVYLHKSNECWVWKKNVISIFNDLYFPHIRTNFVQSLFDCTIENLLCLLNHLAGPGWGCVASGSAMSDADLVAFVSRGQFFWAA